MLAGLPPVTAVTLHSNGVPSAAVPATVITPPGCPRQRPARVTATPGNRSGSRPGATVPGTIVTPSAASASAVTSGAPIRRWMRAAASSRRSSDSTSSQRPRPAAASRDRNPALTAWSMPTTCTRIRASRVAHPLQDLVLVADLPVGDQDQHAVTAGVAFCFGRVGRPAARLLR